MKNNVLPIREFNYGNFILWKRERVSKKGCREGCDNNCFFFFKGSQDGTVHIWSADHGHQVNILDGGHPGPTQCVQFNPRLMMLASACNSMVNVFGCDRIAE